MINKIIIGKIILNSIYEKFIFANHGIVDGDSTKDDMILAFNTGFANDGEFIYC